MTIDNAPDPAAWVEFCTETWSARSDPQGAITPSGRSLA
jgi:hypothetical protein